METEQILPTIGAFTFGIAVGILLFVFLFLPSYQSIVEKNHYADEVINECLEQCPDLYDTVLEGDAWAKYMELK